MIIPPPPPPSVASSEEGGDVEDIEDDDDMPGLEFRPQDIENFGAITRSFLEEIEDQIRMILAERERDFGGEGPDADYEADALRYFIDLRDYHVALLRDHERDVEENEREMEILSDVEDEQEEEVEAEEWIVGDEAELMEIV